MLVPSHQSPYEVAPVLSKSLKALLGRMPVPLALIVAMVLNCLVALSVPVLSTLIGHVVQIQVGLPYQALSARLPALNLGFSELAPLAHITCLLLISLVIFVLVEALLYVVYVLVQQVAVDFEIGMIQQLREQSQRLARVRTLSAQQTSLQDSLEYHLPWIRNVLSMYWRCVPRHPVQCVACLLCASLIHFRFTLLTIVASVLALLLYQWLDRTRRVHLPIARENATRHRSSLINLSLRGPLLAAVHHSRDVERKFAERLESYRRDAIRSLTSSAWKVPALVLCLATLAGVLIFMMSVQLLQGNLPLPSAISFVICLISAAFSVRRMHQVRRDIRHVASAAEELNRFLTQVVPQSDDSLLDSIDKVRQNTVLEHVTVQDSRSRKLLEDVSVAFNSGQLIGIAADQWLEGRALAELLIGLGRPTSGRMLVDGKLAADLKMDSLTRCAHWVASDGSILTGSIAENLSTTNLRFIDPAIELAQLNDLIVRLSEGMNTLVTHDDDRFLADEAFRIGIARALIRQASIVVVEEPEPVHDPSVEQKTLQAVKNLVRPEYLTVVLPKRIGTLRQCDLVVFVHGHRVQDVGSHAELLQRNEVYRHLTYLRFNPYQSGS